MAGPPATGSERGVGRRDPLPDRVLHPVAAERGVDRGHDPDHRRVSRPIKNTDIFLTNSDFHCLDFADSLAFVFWVHDMTGL